MNAKKKILVLVDWYLPGYRAGGPIRSCSNLVAHLRSEFEFSVVTRDTDYLSTQPYENIKSDSWNMMEDGVRVFYLSKRSLGIRNIKKILKEEEYDVLYLNSLYSFYFTLVPLLFSKFGAKRFKIILAPRGMLARGALSKKPFKKKLFIMVSKLFTLFSHISWQASSTNESDDIKRVFGSSAQINIAMNLPQNVDAEFTGRPKSGGTAKFVYVARVAKEKNLLATFDFFQKVTPADSIAFEIYGPIDGDDYWKQCEAAMNQLPAHITASYQGVADHTNVRKILSDNHFLLLPTLGENFGHVILEALSVGCPVIISDRTPWSNLEEKNIGWDISLSEPQQFVSTINKCVSMSQEEYDVLAENAYNLAKLHIDNKDTIEQNRALFL